MRWLRLSKPPCILFPMCEKLNPNDITILCKVVDNFGDIGVVYRLARALTELSGKLNLRIVVDNLDSFSLLEPGVNPSKEVQLVNGWQILQWDSSSCIELFRKNPPHIILECFQCGRPEWLDQLLFSETVPNIVQIIMLDYLTAEPYAETFHKLLSLTRSARVKKINFMPGFTSKTGGLILDKPFLDSLKKGGEGNSHRIVFFSYPKDWTPAVKAFQKFNGSLKPESKLQVKLAKGAGFESFFKAYSECKKKSEDFFDLIPMDFIPQTEWDALLCSADLLFIRGEDSLSRAALCGIPYVWHAYPQSEDYQLVKVQALLDAMKPFFLPELFSIVENCWLIYNGKTGNLEESLTNFLFAFEKLRPSFSAFSASLLKNGNLAQNLLDFIDELCG